MSLDSEAFELLLESWKQQYGSEYRGRTGNTYMVVPGKVMLRREMLRYLIDTLINEHGYQKEDFNTSTKKMIEEACVWPDWEDAKRLREWRKHVYNDIITVLAEAFPDNFVKQDRQEPIARPVIESKSPDSELHQTETGEVNFDENLGPINTGRKEIDMSKIPKIETDWVMLSTEEFLKELEGGTNE